MYVVVRGNVIRVKSQANTDKAKECELRCT